MVEPLLRGVSLYRVRHFPLSEALREAFPKISIGMADGLDREHKVRFLRVLAGRIRIAFNAPTAIRPGESSPKPQVSG
jgi:hypothetical protein